jgi:hypothetical protein
MIKLFLLFISLLLTTIGFSQITGKCVDTLGKPLPYINIGIKNTMIGTITDQDGLFVLNDKTLGEANNLVISHIGYQTRLITATQKETITVVMKSIYYELDEVKVTPKYKYTKEKRIGNNALSKNIVASFSSHNLGAEVGSYFKVSKGKKYKVERVHFNIAEMGYKKATFRINFYNATDEKNIELERSNTKDIIMDISSKGDVDVDVTQEMLEFEKGFLVTIEALNYIKDTLVINKEKEVVYFSSNVFCGPIYLRANHVTNWVSDRQKFNICLGIQLFIKQ